MEKNARLRRSSLPVLNNFVGIQETTTEHCTKIVGRDPEELWR